MPSNTNRNRRDDRSKNYGRPGNQDNKRSFQKDRNSSGEERNFRDSGRSFDKKDTGFQKGEKSKFTDKKFEKRDPQFNRNEGSKFGERSFDRKDRDFRKSDNAKFGERKFSRNRDDNRDERFGDKRESARGFVKSERPNFEKKSGDSTPFYKKKSYGNKFDNSPQAQENHAQRQYRRKFSKPKSGNEGDEHKIRLNRYISNSGVCSRRKADELIAAGIVTVNGTVITEMGYKVDPYKDDVRYNGERLKREKMVYILLNKPKDYITTTDDPQERKTVMHLIANSTKERVYPVGRLDRNTTGLLLLTNDGNLADKLSHPRNKITKIYHVTLNKNLTQGDFNKIEFGIDLEDGFIKPDELSYVQGAGKDEVGIKIHSGKNRIVRRIFESLGYDVIKLDRVVYANLTKKDLPRGRWRFLDEQELVKLKHFI